MSARPWLVGPLCFASIVACAGGDVGSEPVGRVQSASVGGCTCATTGNCAAISYTDVPADGMYYITTFGGGADTQSFGCSTASHPLADGLWAYIADSGRFGCGARVLVEAGGKSCVAEVADCGPNVCVEDAASASGCASHHPIIDASPFISQYLLGSSGVGWSEHVSVHAVEVDGSTPIGCPGGPVGSGGVGGSSGVGGTGGTGTSTGGTGNVAGTSSSGGTGNVAGTSSSGGTGNVAGTSSAGAGNTGAGAGGTTANGCSITPDCSACANCTELCLCMGKSLAECSSLCATDASGGSAGFQQGNSSGDSGSCSLAGSGMPAGAGSSLFALMLAALGGLRRARPRRG